MNKLKQLEIVQLTRCIDPNVEMRAASHDAALARLYSELEARIGRKLTKADRDRLESCEDFLTGHHVIGDIIDPGSSPDQPKPQTERKPTMAANKKGTKTPAKPATKKPAEKKAATSKGNIHPQKGLTENPRREGTHGFNSMKIIMKKPGISYEDFIAAGGRPQDLRWDIEKGNVTLTPAK